MDFATGWAFDHAVRQVACSTLTNSDSGVSPIFVQEDGKWTKESSMDYLLSMNKCVLDCHASACSFKRIEMMLESDTPSQTNLAEYKRKIKSCHDRVLEYLSFLKF